MKNPFYRSLFLFLLIIVPFLNASTTEGNLGKSPTMKSLRGKVIDDKVYLHPGMAHLGAKGMMIQINGMIKQSILFCVFVLPLFGCVKNVHEGILSIPGGDREILEEFFTPMVRYECFGYVLLGEKPMAAGGFETHFDIENTFDEMASRSVSYRFTAICTGDPSL